jgi:sarcosine oxidase, subunit alpha
MASAPPTGVTFRGRQLHPRGGETLLQSLARIGLPILQRSIRYHRPRAPFCGEGFCTQCLVRVNGTPNVRACRYYPRSGDRITTENSWPSPRYDILGVLDLLFRHGIDTLHGFRRPAWAGPLFHRVVRNLAGYGRSPDAASELVGPPERIAAEVLVVGAGPSGRAAAARVVELGHRALLLDRGALSAPPEGVETRAGVTGVFLPPPRGGVAPPFELLASSPERALSIAAHRVILAPGGYDANLFFPGNDRPGVLTAEGSFAVRDSHGDPPFRNALLFGGGARALEMMERFGPQFGVVAAPGPIHGTIAERAAELEIPVHPRTLLLGVQGVRRVRSVTLGRRGGGGEQLVPVDAVVLAHRRLPHSQLFFQVGARMHWRGGAGAYYPVISEEFATSVAGLFAAGESAGFLDPVSAEASGIAAAEAALGRAVALRSLPPRVEEGGSHELEGYYRELLSSKLGSGKWIVCACEDVLMGELLEAHRAGYRGIEVIKRYTSLGTGLCQGRYCLPDTLLLLSLLEARAPSQVGYITQRPPVVPTRLDTLASLPPIPEPVSV